MNIKNENEYFVEAKRVRSAKKKHSTEFDAPSISHNKRIRKISKKKFKRNYVKF